MCEGVGGGGWGCRGEGGPLILCAAGALLALKSPGISSYTRYILFRVHGYPVPNII